MGMLFDDTSLFERNQRLLRQYRPLLWEQLASHPAVTKPLAVEEVQGFLNLVHPRTGEYVHAVNNPWQGAAAFLQKIGKETGGVVFLLGFGLGYEALCLERELGGHCEIKVIDPDPAYFCTAMRYMDLSPLIVNPRVHLFLGATLNDVRQIARQTDRRRILAAFPRILTQTQLAAGEPAFYEAAHDIVFSELSTSALVLSTCRREDILLVENGLNKIPVTLDAMLLSEVSGMADNVPAVLVGAGPSLRKNVHLLRRVQDTVMIAAVDSAVGRLLEHGVTPHLVAAMDQHHRNADFLRPYLEQLEDVCLVYLDTVTPLIPGEFPGQDKIAVFGDSHMPSWLASLFGEAITVPRMNSVAHLLLITLGHLGCAPVMLVGMDLAPEQERISGHDPRDLFEVEGWHGGTVVTTTVFKSQKDSLEEYIQRYAAGKVINATEGGVAIKGTVALELDKALRQLSGRTGRRPRFRVSTAQYHDRRRNVSQRLRQTKNDMTVLRDRCRTIEVRARKACDLFASWKHAFEQGRMRQIILTEEGAELVNGVRRLRRRIDEQSSVVALLETLLIDVRLDVYRRETAFRQRTKNSAMPELEVLLFEMETAEAMYGGMRRCAERFLAMLDPVIERIGCGAPLAAGTTEERLRCAQLLLHTRELRLAEETFQQILADDEDHAAALFGLGNVLLLRRRPAEALALFQRAVARDAALEGAVKMRLASFSRQCLLDAAARLRQGRIQAAVTLLRTVPEGFPHDALARETRRILEREGSCDKALEFLEREGTELVTGENPEFAFRT